MARQLPLPFSSASASFFKLHSSNKPERIMGRKVTQNNVSQDCFFGFFQCESSVIGFPYHCIAAATITSPQSILSPVFRLVFSNGGAGSI